MSSRKFLFLQGVATPFFKELGKAIQKNGHDVFRVNFCGGDSLFTGNMPSWRFSQPLADLPQWLADKHASHRFTDVVLFGDTRPVHTHAIPALKAAGVRVHVFEEGYMRPHWITLEQDGVNGYSQLLNKGHGFWQQDYPTETDEPVQLGGSFAPRAWHDIRYRLANALLHPLYPTYQTHRPFKAHQEYLGWIRRFPSNKLWREHRDKRQIHQLIKDKAAYYLLPLQLDSDAQIRVHSPFGNMMQVIQTVMSSFANNAPADSKLVIKNHPLDTGLLKHEQYVGQLGEALGIGERVIFLETGHLPTLLDHGKGTVLVNSTTGTSALHHGSPTIALGTAIFDLPGLTFQHGLDRFWREGKPADKAAYRRFRDAVVGLTQIKGNFYSRQGIHLAVAGSIKAMQVEPVLKPSPNQPPATPSLPLSELERIIPIPAATYGGKMPETSYLYKKL